MINFNTKTPKVNFKVIELCLPGGKDKRKIKMKLKQQNTHTHTIHPDFLGKYFLVLS